MPPVPLVDPLLDEATGKLVGPDIKPVDQKGPFQPALAAPVSANPL